MSGVIDMHRSGLAALIRWVLAVSSPVTFLSATGTNGILHDVLLGDGLRWLIPVLPTLELLPTFTLALALSASSRFPPIRRLGLKEATIQCLLVQELSNLLEVC